MTSSTTAQTGLRERHLLSGTWRFQMDPRSQGVAMGYTSDACLTTSWLETAVPISVNRIAPGMDFYTGPCWFARSFAVPESWRGSRIVVRFEGVNFRSRVWVNGRFLGEHLDGFTPFEFAIQDAVKPGQDNLLMVEVDTTSHPEDVPGTTRGWHPFGGILRDVLLEQTAGVHVENARISAEPAGGRDAGICAIACDLVNDTAGPVDAQLCVDIVDADRKAIASFTGESRTLAAGGSATLKMQETLAGVVPWSPQAPRLYTARMRAVVGGRSLDQIDVRFGVRRIEVANGQLLLNGKPIYCKGFNRHEDSAARDMCSDIDTVRRDLLDMKAMGCNFVRMCHYPHDSRELDLCDELGLMVMSEIPLWQFKGLREGSGVSAQRIVAAKRQLVDMVGRDYSHPAIIMWSVSNEAWDNRPEVATANDEMVRLVRGLDRTRPVTHVADHWFDEARFEEDDLICLNAYPVHFHDPHFAPEQREGQGNWWRDRLAKVHAKYPNKPIMVTEFGHMCISGTWQNYYGEDAQAAVIESQYAGMHAPYVCGAVIWCYADYFSGGRTSPWGVVSRDRTHKKAAHQRIREMFLSTQKREN